jgi:hypothetical protein
VTTNWFNWQDPGEPDPDLQVWTLADIYADLGTSTDVAAYLNVDRTRVRHWVVRSHITDSPKPVAKIGSFNVYSKVEWADWFENFLKDKKHHTAWTENALPFREHRRSRLDPNFKFGNPGINNALRDWRRQKKAEEAAREAEAQGNAAEPTD